MQDNNLETTNVLNEDIQKTQSKNNNFLITLLSTLLLISVFIAGFFAYQTQHLVVELNKVKNVATTMPSATPSSESTALPSNTPESTSSSVACTMEAKICPDGSAVGRSGPKCEFAACPTAKPTAVTSPRP